MSIMNQNTIIKLENVFVNLKSNIETIEVLKGINLNILANKSICIMGHSGAGKSTLAMTIAGLENITKGKIFYKDQPIHDLKEDDLADYRAKNVGIIFQSFNLLPSMTALENVNLPLEISGNFIDDRQSIKLLESVGLENRINHYPHELSGGEQQRVAIARSLISSPEIIIADEPTGNLDKKNSEAVIKLIFELQKNHNSTLILVTHDKSIANFCDEIITLDNGLIL
ncbi:MAG: ABC transporter ATP-binding protein [Alphaproteobacteria bacterium]|jgi:putative ABC transport system ATP-binding protein|nr:ABC transporter ATP-binding protein [Alphaproteobacteria bacterium]MBL6850730.1 ABC transporter ATP-binding protein [Alphaproteobacteria bacterium]